MKHKLIKSTDSIFMKVLKIAGMVVLGVAGACLLAFVFGYFVMLLWNWLMPSVFGLASINFWQAVGIIVLARLIFGSLGGHSKTSSKKHRSDFCTDSLSDKFSRIEKWSYYDKYWEEEGKQAFADYVSKQKEQDNS